MLAVILILICIVLYVYIQAEWISEIPYKKPMPQDGDFYPIQEHGKTTKGRVVMTLPGRMIWVASCETGNTYVIELDKQPKQKTNEPK